MQWTATIIRSTSVACLLCLVTGTGHAQFRDVTPGRESEEVEPRLEPTPMQEVEPNTFVEPGQRVSSDTSEAAEVEAFGDDLAEGKPTLPLIYAMQKGSAEDKELIRNAIVEGGLDQLERITAIIEATGALEYTAMRAQKKARVT